MSSLLPVQEDQGSAYTLKETDKITYFYHGPHGDMETAEATVLRRIPSEAAHSWSYEAKAANGRKLFIKSPSLDVLAPDSLKSHIQRVENTFQREYAARDRLNGIEYVPKILGFGVVELSKQKVPLLVQEYIPGQKLKDYLHEKFSFDVGEFRGMRSTSEWFALAKHIVRVTKRIHNRYVVHGDLGPRNLLVRTHTLKPGGAKKTKREQDLASNLYIVDFGQSFLIDLADKSKIRSGNQIKAYWAPERFERTLGMWDVSADVYSLGGILYYLATGHDPEPEFRREKNEGALKRLIQDQIRQLNRTLFTDNEGIIKIIDKCLRYRPADRYFCVENLLFDLDTFDFGSRRETNLDKRCHAVMEELKKASRSLGRLRNPLFRQLFLKNAEILLNTASGMARSHCEIFGHRDQVIDHVCRYMSMLEQGDSYVTVTTPSFWTAENLGVNGRFFTMNKVMARRGVKIARVFIVTAEELTAPKYRAILSEHLGAARELLREGISGSFADFSPGTGKCFYAGFLLMTEADRAEYFNNNNHIAIWRKASDSGLDASSLMSLHFSFSSNLVSKSRPSEPNADKIVKVRFWLSQDLEDAYAKLIKRCEESKPLEELEKKLQPEPETPP